jgi:NAD-specific glutamate dehydrogenase
MNTVDKLVSSINQIVANLMHDPDPVSAAAQHIHLFWDPRSKKLIQDYDGNGLSPGAAAAVTHFIKTHAAR